MTRTVDYMPLIVPVTKDEVAAFKAETRAAGIAWGQGAVAQGLAVGCVSVIIGVVAVVMVSTFVRVSADAFASTGSPVGLVGVLFPLLFLAGLVALGIGALRSVFGMRRWEKWMRLSRFAAANQLVFSASSPDPDYPGSIFGQGHSRKALDHLRSTSGRFLDMGNYQYETGSGKNRTTHNWGFMALKLDRRLPHMVLDSTANNGWFGTNLPSTFKKDQALALEGDFNSHFTLYCPRQYERDAYYVFTPDLMALLIDNASPFDVEIIDRWMFVYSTVAFDLEQPGLHQRMLQIVDTVGAKTLTQTDRYVDERIGQFPPNIVAPQGQRLRRRFPVWLVVMLAVVGGLFVGPFLIAIIAFIVSAASAATGG